MEFDSVGTGYGLGPLLALLHEPGVVGVSRLCVIPAFTRRVFCTLVYGESAVQIKVVGVALDRPWLPENYGGGPFEISLSRSLAAMENFGFLASWKLIWEASEAAPSCRSLVTDGVEYYHSIMDRQRRLESCWSNPDRLTHRVQSELAAAYESLMLDCGSPPI